jgi:D-specific alpha-keto acid dehydrogenase
VRVGITVYGCEPDEAEAFSELAPRLGVVPSFGGEAVSDITAAAARGNRCVSVGHKSPVSARELLALKEAGVEYVCTRSIGFDHIDLEAAERLGIAVENVIYAPDGVADYTLMLILMAIRDATATLHAAAGHDFRLASTRGRDLCDLTVGVVGVGHIGTAVIGRLQGFRCRVLAYDNGRTVTVGAEDVPFEDLLRESDVVTLHVPLNAATHHLLGRREIATMKRGAVLVNTSRGALVDTDALIAALESRQLGGAALDVLEGEEGLFYVDCSTRPVRNEHLLRLQEMPNAIVTPHTAYYTERALSDTVEGTLANCLDFERRRAHATTQDRDLVRGLLGGA